MQHNTKATDINLFHSLMQQQICISLDAGLDGGGCSGRYANKWSRSRVPACLSVSSVCPGNSEVGKSAPLKSSDDAGGSVEWA